MGGNYEHLMDEGLREKRIDLPAELQPDSPESNKFNQEAPKRDPLKQIISIVNHKGGCGKTTTAINLSAALAKQGYKVLLMDADPQSHASLALGFELDENHKTIHDILANGVPVEDAIKQTQFQGLDIVTANGMLLGSQVELVSKVGREFILKIAMQKFLANHPYDYICIDCAPSLNLVTINTLVAANYVLIPFQTQYFSLEGMKELLNTVDIIKGRINSKLEILGLLATLHDQRNKINRTILEQARAYFKDKIFQTVIRINVKLCEAPIYRLPISEYAEHSRGAEDYGQLTQEVVERIGQRAVRNLASVS